MRRALHHLKKSDPVLRAIIEGIGPCRMQFGPPQFHSLAESIVYQQLNGRAAETIFRRFTALAGDRLTPEVILQLSDEQMRGAGLSKQKSGYLKDLASKTAAGLLDFSILPDLPDAEVIERLTQVKGIGEWTAQMFLMFTLKRENVLPPATTACAWPYIGTISPHGRRKRPSEGLPEKSHLQRRKGRSRKSNYPRRGRWKRSLNAGNPTAVSRAGICGKASIASRSSLLSRKVSAQYPVSISRLKIHGSPTKAQF